MNKQSGFSMLEVLVSLIIIMIGVLGIAGIQMVSIYNTEVARYQSLAAMLGSSLSANMQGNAAYWKAQTISITTTGATVSGGPAAGACLNAACTASQIAGYDLALWAADVSGTLPSATSAIDCTISTNATTDCAITISWSEKNITLNKLGGTEAGSFASGTSNTRSYQTVVSVR